MKVVIETSFTPEGFLCEDMIIDEQLHMSVRPLNECPEDSYIEKDLVSPSEVVSLMKKAHEAGMNGEVLEIKYKEEKYE